MHQKVHLDLYDKQLDNQNQNYSYYILPITSFYPNRLGKANWQEIQTVKMDKIPFVMHACKKLNPQIFWGSWS